MEQGSECGISLEGLRFELKENDVIEGYKVGEVGESKFNSKSGVIKSF